MIKTKAGERSLFHPYTYPYPLVMHPTQHLQIIHKFGMTQQLRDGAQ
jgi:hypothetical protein